MADWLNLFMVESGRESMRRVPAQQDSANRAGVATSTFVSFERHPQWPLDCIHTDPPFYRLLAT